MLLIKKGIYLLIIFFLLQIELGAQSDSTILAPDRLGITDIHITKEEVATNKIYTASRTLNNIEELPFSVYIITGEEILERGFFTLGDVLKHVPGIFVSQPGSALHGETFIMNGLYGNTHTKIMVDNIPVKPYNASGTPIANQLPIRQAERIEVTYGPSALNNGSDAGAGTINIVTRKSERPVYVYSDLAVGTDGYNNINVLFGGKLGKKNTLNFNAYATTTFLSDINISEVTPYFDPDSYPLNSFSVLQDTFLSVGELPLTSRQISINLKFNSFRLTLTQMQRSSHSAIGSSPAAIKYSKPTTTFGESINLVNFIYQKDLKKVGYKFQMDFARLNVNKESSFEYSFPFAKLQIDRIIDENSNGNTAVRDSAIAVTDARYFQARRFAGGSSTELKASGSISFFPIKNVELILSPDVAFIGNTKYDIYSIFPITDTNFSTGDRYLVNVNLIARAYIKFEKINLILGVNRFSNFSGFDNIDQAISRGKLLPQFAGLYKLTDRLTLKANYSTSFLIPSIYWRDQGGEISTTGLNQSINVNNIFRQNPQETKYGEVALRCKLNEKVKMDLALFTAENTNLLSYTTEETENVFLYGYDNSDGRSSRISGIRFSIQVKNIIERIKLNIKANYNYNQGQQDLPSGETLDGLLTQPKHISQFNINFEPLKNLSISVDNVFIGKYSSSNLQSIEEFNEEANTIFQRNANWSMNVSAAINLSDNFKIFVKGNNFNKSFLPGIDATGSPDDISLNTQRETYFVIGVSYNLD